MQFLLSVSWTFFYALITKRWKDFTESRKIMSLNFTINVENDRFFNVEMIMILKVHRLYNIYTNIFMKFEIS